jgi:hypothetical protein
MSNPSSYENAVSRLASQSDAIGRLAQNNGGFAAVVAAFESKDANAFRWVLDRLEMLPYCELICEWVRIKLCALRCAEICGPFREKAEIPNLQKFAQAVVKLGSDEKLLRRVVDAVSCGDGSEYRAAIEELKLGDFCQLICYWVCSIGYDRICEIVCGPRQVLASDAASELRVASQAMASFVKNEKVFDAIGKGAVALNCEILQSAINQAGFQSGCEIICRLICIWRHVWVCRELCEVPPQILTGAYGIEEAQQFALAARQLANQPRVLGDLVTAVQNRDAKGYRAIVERFNLIPYCWQVCAWVGSVTCFEFCRCVCPPKGPIPLFTSVGIYDYTTDINSTSGGNGLTIADSRAFFDTLRLNGVLTQTLGGQPMEYCFETIATDASGTPLGGAIWTPVLQSNMAFTLIGTWEHFPPLQHKQVWVNGVQPGHDGVPAAGDMIVYPDVNGWIQVPQGTIVTSSSGAISLNDNMIELISQTLATWTHADETGVVAGGPAAHPLVQDLYFGIRMRVRQVGVPLSEQDGGTCTHIAIDDTLYDNVKLHPDWAGGTYNNQYAVVSVDIKELQTENTTIAVGSNGQTLPQTTINVVSTVGFPSSGTIAVVTSSGTVPVTYTGITGTSFTGCSGGTGTMSTGGFVNACADVSDSLTVLFTAAHPNLGPVSISMTGPGGPYTFTLPPLTETGDWYGTAINGFTLADLIPCAYLVTLSVTPLLTDGDVNIQTFYDQIAFCKTS